MRKKRSLKPVFSIVMTALMFLSLGGCAAPAAPPAEVTSTVKPTAPIVEASVAFEEGITWDDEYDVVVVGFGGAGAVSAITAADAGAKVLVVEKAPEGLEGGNTRYAAQIVLSPKDREKALAYFKVVQGGFDTQTDEILELIVDGLMDVRHWLTSMGAELVDAKYIEFPEFPGSDSMDTVLVGKRPTDAAFWKLLRSNVYERTDNVNVWYNSPGLELIQDVETKIIHGVKVKRDGEALNVRAKNGVVLACGGFENNEEMIENYTQMPYSYPFGTLYNTGDGIKMAQRVGADLWHMSAKSGHDVNFKAPENSNPFYLSVQSASADKHFNTSGFMSGSALLIGPSGQRFTREDTFPKHGRLKFAGEYLLQQIPTPAYLFFDEAARLNAPVYSFFSEGNVEEIEKGWITKADTLEDLSEKMGIELAGLQHQIEIYNKLCKDGEDVQFGRDPQFMVPIGEGPYYAMELVPTMINTQGGPKRDVACQVIDLDGDPIPHLYSAGELGSFYADAYNGGGNLGECVFTGRIAGANAAAAKTDVLSKSMMDDKEFGLITDTSKPPITDGIELAADEVLGVGDGMGGLLVVKLKMDGATIVSAEIVKNMETPMYAAKALIELPKRIVEAQSAQIDVVTGATKTTEAVIEATKDALSKVK